MIDSRKETVPIFALAHAALKITGLKNFIGNPGFSNLVQQLHRLAAEGNKTAIEALDKARREAPGNVEDEALAYLVQYADEKLPSCAGLSRRFAPHCTAWGSRSN